MLVGYKPKGNFQEKFEEIYENIKNNDCRVEFLSENGSDINLGNCQGNLLFNLKNGGNLILKRLTIGRLGLKATGDGLISMHISRIYSNSSIDISEGTDLKLVIDRGASFNIFSINQSLFYKNINLSHQPTLFINGPFQVENIVENDVQDFFTEFRKRMGDLSSQTRN